MYSGGFLNSKYLRSNPSSTACFTACRGIRSEVVSTLRSNQTGSIPGQGMFRRGSDVLLLR